MNLLPLLYPFSLTTDVYHMKKITGKHFQALYCDYQCSPSAFITK